MPLDWKGDVNDAIVEYFATFVLSFECANNNKWS